MHSLLAGTLGFPGDKSRHSTFQEVMTIGEVYDSGLQYMPLEVIRSIKIHSMKTTLLRLGLFGPSAAENALCDAYLQMVPCGNVGECFKLG